MYTNQTPSKHFWMEICHKFNTPQKLKKIYKYILNTVMRGSRGGGGGRGFGPPPPPPPPPPPWKLTKIKGFLDPLKITHKAAKQTFTNIQCRDIISTPAQPHFKGVSLAGRCWPAYNGILILPALIKPKIKKRPLLTKLSRSAHTGPIE